MEIYNSIARRVILPLSDLVLSRSISQKLDFLDKSQWWSRGDLEAFQEEKLRKLIEHAYEQVPFYRERFDMIKLKPSDIKKKEDLKKIPILKKEEIRKAFPHKIIAQNLNPKRLIKGISSGSTGQPLQYYHTSDSRSMWAACGIRAWNWMGYKIGDYYAKLSQNPRKGLSKKAQDVFNRSDYFFIEHLSDIHFKKVCDKLLSSKPYYIRCYPDPLHFLAKYIIKNKISGIQPKAINTTGNILYPESRKIIEKAFNAPVYDSYSCEGGPNVSQAPGREVYLSSMEYALSEYISADGHDVEYDQPGRHIVTDLWNYANPFIRYDTQDFLVKSRVKPSCGRQLASVDKVLGRDTDILITPDGRLIIVHIFTIYFEWKDSVDQFQVIQHTANDFEMLLQVNEKFSEKIKKEVSAHWQKYLGEEAKLLLRVVDHITPAPSGKRKFLIRNENVRLPI